MNPLKEDIEKIVEEFAGNFPDIHARSWLREKLTSLVEKAEERYYQPAETVNLTKYQKAYEKGAQAARRVIMSNYYAKAYNPRTNKLEEAEMLDNYFSHREYGVRFKDGCVYPEEEVKFPKRRKMR